MNLKIFSAELGLINSSGGATTTINRFDALLKLYWKNTPAANTCRHRVLNHFKPGLQSIYVM